MELWLEAGAVAPQGRDRGRTDAPSFDLEWHRLVTRFALLLLVVVVLLSLIAREGVGGARETT